MSSLRKVSLESCWPVVLGEILDRYLSYHRDQTRNVLGFRLACSSVNPDGYLF